MSVLLAFSRPLRWSAAGLFLTGAGLASTSAVLALSRLGVGPALVFAVVAVVSAVLAAAVLQAARWALWIAAVGLAGQIFGVVGTVWELATGIDEGKAAELRRLGFDPTAGVLINLLYSAAASLLFGWLMVRWLRLRHTTGGVQTQPRLTDKRRSIYR